jgi:hypothetical protein
MMFQIEYLINESEKQLLKNHKLNQIIVCIFILCRPSWNNDQMVYILCMYNVF